MKNFKLSRRVLACVLAISMVLGISSTTFAAVEDPISYVSLGDSMTNGYGLEGYDANSGVEDYGNGSYANLFAAWLGATDHKQLAMSAMRAEDLHWLLELDYENAPQLWNETWNEDAWNNAFSIGDYWTWNEICNHSRTDATIAAIDAVAEYEVDGIDDVAKYYQEAVKNADVISLGMGNGNFGVFAFGRIMEAIGFNGTPAEAMRYNVERAISECEPEMQAKILELKNKLYEKVAPFRATFGDSFDDAQWDALLNTVVYTGLSYVLNYAGSIEAILQLNPDAEIILVALMNTFAEPGAEVDYTNISSLGDIMGAIFEPLNMFIAGLPTYMQAIGNGVYKDAVFYYAEAPEVDCIVNTYEDAIANGFRDRFVESIVGTNVKPGMVWDLLEQANVTASFGASLEYVTLAEIEDYEDMPIPEKAGYAVSNKNDAISCALYLAFEGAILDAADATVDLESVMGLGNLSPDVFEGVMAGFTANIGEASAAYTMEATDAVYDIAAEMLADEVNAALATAMPGVSITEDQAAALLAAEDQSAAIEELALVLLGQIGVAQMTALHGGSFANTLTCTNDVCACNGIFKALNDGITLAKTTANDSVELLCMLLAVPETLSVALTNDATINGLLGLFARCIIGNGLGAHPSAMGHITLSEALIKAYGEGYTAQDQTIENIKGIILEYYDEAYAKAYDELDKNGYVDIAASGIDAAIEAIRTIDVSGTQMTDDFKAKLAEELSAVVGSLEKIKAVLDSDAAKDVNGLYAAVTAVEDDLWLHLANAGALLDQAGIDVKTLAGPVVDAYITELLGAIYNANEDIKNSIDEFLNITSVEELKAKFDEYINAIKDKASLEFAKLGHKHYEGSNYVAIGGDTLKGTGLDIDDLLAGTASRYADSVKNELGIANGTVVAQEKLLAAEVADLVMSNAQNIAAADLITYQLDASSFVNGIFSDEDVDWSKNIDAEVSELFNAVIEEATEILTADWAVYANAELDEVLAEVLPEVQVAVAEYAPLDIDEEKIDAIISLGISSVKNAIDFINTEKDEAYTNVVAEINSIDDMVIDFAEKIAYTVVSFTVESVKAVETIQTINPEATLLVVGMYNPLSGLEVVVEGETYNVGEMAEYVIDVTNAFYYAYAAINKDFAFVDVSDAEANGFSAPVVISDIETAAVQLVNLLRDADALMHASAAGHVYIKDQIVNALTCDYSVYEQLDADNHTVKCSICAHEKVEAHNFIDTTCDKCGYTKTVTPDPTPTPSRRPSGGSAVSTEFTITFETNGGSAVAKVFVEKGGLLVAPANPTKEGFVFDGWYTDKALTAKYDFATPVTKSFTLYAKWAEEGKIAKFTDIDSEAWYYHYVTTIVEKGLMNGISETEFAPEDTLTRGMFVTILYRVEGEPAVENGVNFTDVAAGQYYENAVKWGNANGIVKGITETEFAPDAEVTREQMAAMISRYADYKKLEVPAKDDVKYTDSEMISEYAKAAVETANKLGVIIGNTDGSFAPKKNATRAEATALFARLLGVLKK